ncbi:MAG: SH3 domain-containing protein [Lachnospiraceae bacterium]|nr:SH3 domain-containing protein [Lachnospiraceae bacterium]
MFDNRRIKAVLICLLLVLAVAVFTSGCQLLVKDTETESETDTETDTETEAMSETETETEFETDVAYISEDETIRIVLPDSTWKVTQDVDEMRVFSSESGAMINIVHAADESAMKNISAMTSQEELEETLSSQYPEEDAFEILLFEERSSSTVVTYEYVVKYNYSTSMWAYSVTYALLSVDEDMAYVVTGTVTDDEEDVLEGVQDAVESFTVLDENSIFHVLPGAVENNISSEDETEDGDDTDTSETTAWSTELSGLSEYSSSVTMYATSSVNIRQYPSTEAERVGSLLEGNSVTVTGATSKWYRVSVGSVVGYISKAYLSSTAPETSSSDDDSDDNNTTETDSTQSAMTSAELSSEITYGTTYTYYTTSDVNVRSQPSTGSSVNTTVASGTAVTVVGETDNWFVVSVNGTTGYISKAYVSTSSQSASTDTSTDTSSDSSGTSTDSSGTDSSSSTGAVSGTVTAVTSDTLLIYGDDGVTYSIYYANASLNSSGLTEGLYVTATIDYSQSTASGSLYATYVGGY